MARSFITSLRIPLLAGALFGLACFTPPVWASEARPEDVAAVSACLKMVANNAAAVPTPGTTGTEAPRKKRDCIGIVSAPCLQRSENASTAGMVGCIDRETAVWDARLNAAYKTVMAKAEPDVAEGFRKVQRAWIAYRDATCAQPYVVHKGTMAQPMGAHCMMDQTANQSIWLESWLDEL